MVYLILNMYPFLLTNFLTNIPIKSGNKDLFIFRTNWNRQQNVLFDAGIEQKRFFFRKFESASPRSRTSKITYIYIKIKNWERCMGIELIQSSPPGFLIDIRVRSPLSEQNFGETKLPMKTLEWLDLTKITFWSSKVAFFEKLNLGFSNIIVKKVFAPLIFFEKKSLPPWFFSKKSLRPPVDGPGPGTR